MKVFVIANCQARPVATLCARLAPSVEIIGVGITHLLSKSDEGSIENKCQEADIVLAQLVQNHYPIDFVRPAYLKHNYGDKVFFWPNLFFRGQNPDLFYATVPGQGRVMGPLAEYHLGSVLLAWRAGRQVAETLRVLRETGDQVWESAGEASLVELRERETSAHVAASDLIAARWRNERLFFTFNHPRANLIQMFVRRLLAAAGLSPASDVVAFGEPLGRIVPPTTSAMCKLAGLHYDPTDDLIRGVTYGDSPATPITYTLDALVETFFRAYDSQADAAKAARLS
jgi:hypothetical protein